MNLHRGRARIAVTAGVVLAVVSFVAGPIAYKAFGRPYRYMVPGPGERVTQVFGKAEAEPFPVFPKIRTGASHPEAASHLLAPLPLPARSGMSLGEWVLVGMMATLAGLVVFVIVMGGAAQALEWIFNGFRGQRSSNDEQRLGYEGCAEDRFIETNMDTLASVKGLCYEELVGLELEEFDFNEETGKGDGEGIAEAQQYRLAAVTV